MLKSGKAQILTLEQQQAMFQTIKNHRHPEKNSAIMQISFKLGLRAQEISALKIKHVAQLNESDNNFELLDFMSLPARYTQGGKDIPQRTLTFDRKQFDKVIEQIQELVKSGHKIHVKDFYPRALRYKGAPKDLPMVDADMRDAIAKHIKIRCKNGEVTPSSSLFITQKGGEYSPNTLQQHMALMLKKWAGIEKASSHSGRRSLLTSVINQNIKPIRVAQELAGHMSAATTLHYYEDTSGLPHGDLMLEALNFNKNT